MILQSACHDLAGTGTILIDENDHRVLLPTASACSEKPVFRLVAAASADHQLAPLQEALSDLNCRRQCPPGIAAQIQDQRFHIGLLQVLESLFEFRASGLRELRDADVSDSGLNLKSVLNGVDRNLISLDGEVERFCLPDTLHRDVDGGPFGPLQAGNDLFIDIPVLNRLTADFGDHVPGLNPGFVAGVPGTGGSTTSTRPLPGASARIVIPSP